jgi:hypothetical protein
MAKAVNQPGELLDRSVWSAQSVDARKEMQDELLDLYNYASLLDDEVLGVRVHLICRDLWQELKDMGA